jgi:hypothetical protein
VRRENDLRRGESNQEARAKMKNLAILVVVAAMSHFLTGLAHAEHLRGQVKEIIIKIETKDGAQWYRLGKELEEIDIHEGDYVTFDYADDTIESIEVEKEAPESQGATKSE